ncbi:MAG TPA: hypothetical protein VIN11_02305 [Roseivirga sp.]
MNQYSAVAKTDLTESSFVVENQADLVSGHTDAFFHDATQVPLQRNQSPLEISDVEFEETEDEQEARKKSLCSSLALTILCLAIILGAFQNYLANRLPNKRQLIRFTSFKWFILFQVFRI